MNRRSEDLVQPIDQTVLLSVVRRAVQFRAKVLAERERVVEEEKVESDAPIIFRITRTHDTRPNTKHDDPNNKQRLNSKNHDTITITMSSNVNKKGE